MNSLCKVVKEEHSSDGKMRPYYFKGCECIDDPSHPCPDEDEVREKEQESAKLVLIEKEAYEKGYQQGEKAGMVIVEKRMQILYKRLEENIEKLAGIRRKLLEKSDKDILKVALAVAKKILQREVTVNDGILNVIKAALAKIVDKSRLVIRLNPEDYQHLMEKPGQLESITENTAGISLEKDNNIARGGCVVETPYGELDARIASQFRAIEEELLGGNG